MTPKSRPRPYTQLDRDYLAQDTIRDLGDHFGAEGPLAFLALILNAGKAITGQAPATAFGVVDLRWRTLAREAFTTPEKVREIVAACVEFGLLDEYTDLPSGRFSARLTKAERWETRPLSGAERTAAWRAKQADDA